MKTYLKLAAAAVLMVAGATDAMAQAKKPAAKAAAKPAAAAMAPKGMKMIGGKPNLNGIWQVMGTANWGLEPRDAAEAPAASEQIGAIGAIPASVGYVVGGKIPYKPEALAQLQKNRSRVPVGDPEAACYLPGIPRATYINMPFQIIQADNGDMLMVYEYDAANRVIFMKPVEVPPINTWMGTSYGAWEGNTLKVVTLSQDPGLVILPGVMHGAQEQGVTWLDRTGNYLTSTATVTERFKPLDADHIAYEAIIDDPSIYTKPWTIKMTLYRNIEPGAQLLDFRCVPFADKLLFGDLLADKDKYPRK